MLNELCITLTMRLVMLGHSLAEAHELAVMILIQLVLLCTLLGYRRILPDETGRQEYRAVPVRVCSNPFMGVRGIPRPVPGPRSGVPALLSSIHSPPATGTRRILVDSVEEMLRISSPLSPLMRLEILVLQA